MSTITEITLQDGKLCVRRHGKAIYLTHPAPPAGIHDDRESYTIFVDEVDALISLLQRARSE